MRIFPSGGRGRCSRKVNGSGLRPLRISFISLVVSLTSVLVMGAVAGACSINSTQVYTSNGSSVASGSSVANGSSVYDVATVSDKSGYTVSFNLYSGTCPSSLKGSYGNSSSSASGYLQSVVLPHGTLNALVGSDTPSAISGTGGNITNYKATSSTFGPLGAGSYFFIDYDSAGYVGPCEPFSVVNAPSVTTTLSKSSIALGGTFSDTATVSGGSSPTGSVIFNVYASSSCSGTVLSHGSGSVSGGQAVSGSLGPINTAGTYYVLATYGGDSNNAGASSVCGSEVVTVTSPPPPPPLPSASLSTTPTVHGLSATDSATVSGTSGTPTGSVTFTLYSGSPGSGRLVTGYSADTVSLTSGQASSASTGTLAAGSYYFVVTYSGDGSYSAITPGATELFIIIPVNAPKPPKTKTPPYKIPTSAPQTGAGGAAGVTFNGGLLSIGSLMLLAGLVAMAFTRRRRNA